MELQLRVKIQWVKNTIFSQFEEKGRNVIKMENIILKINGMKCTGCSQRLEKALKNTDGVQDAVVDFESRESKIVYDARKISTQNIYETVSDVGFEVEE